MRSPLLLYLACLLCLLYCCLLPAVNGLAGEKDECECSMDAIEALFKKKGLNADQLAKSAVDAILNSYSDKKRLIDLLLDNLTAEKIVTALSKSSRELTRLDEIINGNALRRYR